MDNREALYLIADELRALASMGLHFNEHGYDHERYEHILRASARMVAVLDGTSFEEVYAQYTGNPAHFSPLMAVEALVFRAGNVLLIQRRDDQLWAVPGGLVEVGESPAQAAERELWEEAGLRGKAVRLLGIYDSRNWPGRSRFQIFTTQFLVESEDQPALHTLEGNTPSPLSEALAVDFYSENELPPLSPGHDKRLAMAFRLMRGDVLAPHFDP